MTAAAVHKKFVTKKRIAAFYAGGRASVKKVGRCESGDFVDRFAPATRGVIVSDPETGESFFLSRDDALRAAKRWIDHCKRVATQDSLSA